MKVRRPSTGSGSRAQPREESVQTRRETGTQRREALRHTHAVCRRAEQARLPVPAAYPRLQQNRHESCVLTDEVEVRNFDGNR
jgi:hypothetical protein